MSKNEIALAFNEVLEEKQLSKEIILGAIESAMASAYRKAVNASTAQHVEAKIDLETGKVLVFAEKEVVEDIIEPKTEVLLDEARQVNPEAQLGDMVIVETTPKDFGRVAAQTARQVIQQRIREAERSNQMQYFERQIGEIVSGVVQATNAQATTVGLDMKAEGMLPANQRIPGERFKVHDRVRAVVLEVKDGSRGPQIVLSRGHRNFLRRLLENEVPEIYHGIVEIRAISREPGARAKVAVMATQAGVDPVGACVGIKGVRIQAIVKELHDEKIDIIQWDQDPVVYISKAISPARVTGVYVSDADGNKTATVVVQEDQLSLAIGRDGQNARLAAKLTGWRIDIKSLTEAAGDALQKLQNDAELSALMPNAVEAIPSIEESLAKKAENRPLTPEEFTALAQFVDRVERRTIQIKEEAARAEGVVTGEHSDIPTAAFGMPLEQAGIKEHTYNILVEAGYDTVGSLMATLKTDSNRILGLAGIGPKAMQNIEEALAAIQFPETPPADVTAEPAVEAVSQPEALPVEAMPPTEKQASTKKDARKAVEEDEDEHAKDGVSLDELFAMKPEIFQTAGGDDESADKKKGKKVKKKSVELVLDEERGEVVGRKKHKRGGDAFGEEE
ncbi:MAG: transcription termination/antitermination protein NusA [Anaerolineales bacterium]|nr:transcription termination/antitermination protein NusA [Anaerolineales bacterium]MCC7188923.1 transcription termination/antitermination protein NusA [Anaerolineales bacterium]